jgi:large subunit ribosomal protein L9
MKVILTADLPHIGQVGQIVDVANGYGRNYLLPRGFAILATPGNERSLAQQQRARLAREAKTKAEAEALAAQLQALSLSIAKKTGEGDRLYGSVTSMEIADLVKARGIALDRGGSCSTPHSRRWGRIKYRFACTLRWWRRSKWP